MRNSIGIVLGLAGLVCSASGCSDSDPVEVARDPAAPVFSVFAKDAKPDMDDSLLRSGDDEDVAPVIESVSFDTRDPMTRGRIRAKAKVTGSWTALTYDWSVNGDRFGGNSLEATLPVIKTGDTISVRVVPIRGVVEGEAMTASIVAKNQRPNLVALRMEPAAPGEGGFSYSSTPETDLWKAVVGVEDPDGDSVNIEYRWYVNGERSDVDEEFFPAGNLVRGDRIELEARAFDGQAWSEASRTGQIEIGNNPPSIVSRPPRVDARGQFRYQIRAEDPDGDTQFRYSLKQSPRGMQLDEVNGIVRWEPDTDQAGRHSVEIAVTDEGGAESTQSFSLALVTRSDADSPGPAASR